MVWLKVAKRAHQDAVQVAPGGPQESVQDVGIGVVSFTEQDLEQAMFSSKGVSA